MTILVVSTLPANCDLIKRALAGQINTVLRASSSHEALGLLEDTSCDGIWIDSHGLGMRGTDLAAQARQMFPGLITVLWTSTEVSDPRLIDIVIGKPTSMNTLKETADRLIQMNNV